MATTLPPDPYAALGVSKTADSAAIKAAYRKLVLKCHPDKVTDESLKAQKREEFDKIQQAYEIVGDDDKRQNYEAELKLESLRREKLARSSSDPRVEVRTTSYDIRTAAPGGASFRERGPSRYDDRKTSRYEYDRYDEDRSSSRKYDTYDAYPKRSSPRTARTTEKEAHVRPKVSSDRSRSDYKKTRDQAERRERTGKFVHIDDDSSSDEKARWEAEYRRRSEEAQYEARKRYDEETKRKAAAEIRQTADTRRRTEERRSAEESRRHREHRDERERKLSDQETHLRDYMNQAKASHAETRPSASRTNSSRDVRPEYHKEYERTSRRPEPVRRSSATRPKDQPPSSGRERRPGMPEIVEWDEDERRVPSFKQTASSPAEIHVPRMGPQRSFTESSSREQRRSETSPTPVMRRSETMPHSSSSSRRHEATPARTSNLRSTETVQPHDSGYSSPSTPEATYPTIPPASKKYHYSSASGGVRLVPDDISNANGHRTILREPDRHHARSPSPLGRPPIGSNRVVKPSSSSRYQTTAPVPPPTSATIPPPLNRSATINVSPSRADDRDRGRKLYGEIGSEHPKRPSMGRQTSFSPERVSYTRRIGPDDIRWSRGRDPVIARPPMKKMYSVF